MASLKRWLREHPGAGVKRDGQWVGVRTDLRADTHDRSGQVFGGGGEEEAGDDAAGLAALTPFQTSTLSETPDTALAVLREEVRWLREELLRRDQLLAAALQRIPQGPALPAPSPLEDRGGDRSSPSPWWQFWRK